MMVRCDRATTYVHITLLCMYIFVIKIHTYIRFTAVALDIVNVTVFTISSSMIQVLLLLTLNMHVTLSRNHQEYVLSP